MSLIFFAKFFQRYEYDPSIIDFHLSKFLKILLKIRAQQETQLYSDLEVSAEYYLFLMIYGKKNTWSFKHLTITYSAWN